MLKLSGILLVLTASIGLACQIRTDLKEHLLLLYDMRKLLFDIANEMAYSMEPVEQIFKSVHSRNRKLEEMCRLVGQRLQEKETGAGSEAWKSCAEIYRRELGMTEEEMEIFSGAGSSFFGKSLQENERALEHDIARLEEVIGLAKKEQKEKQKVYQTAVVMCGLIVILVFL